MSYVSDTSGDEKYRGGYGSSSSFNPDELRVATSTFDNYISGTVLLVFLIFFVFLFISGITVLLMCYARYLNHRRPKGGFYNPPPMISRYGRKNNGGTSSTNGHSVYSTLQRRSEYSTNTGGGSTVAAGAGSASLGRMTIQQLEQPPTAPSAMSFQTEASYTATSTML